MGICYKEAEIDEYVRQYPKFNKWVLRCSGCGRQGLSPSTPRTFMHLNLFRYLKPMEISDRGLCDECERATTNLMQNTGF